MTVATKLAVELLRFQPEVDHARSMLTALLTTSAIAGIELAETSSYHGASPWLVFWGPGAPARQQIMQAHVAAGGHAIALDLAYWSRERKVRLSIDAPHPQAWVMRRHLSGTRLRADMPPVADLWNPHGPIIVAGIGRKAKVQYGAVVDRWETEMLQVCQSRWPKRVVVMRPKPVGAVEDIESILAGASLVVTWHSNIAVDAIRCGIPVVCRDGAAAAVCPSELPDDPLPLPIEVRDRFLGNLAWFQWASNEAINMWRFLQELLA